MRIFDIIISIANVSICQKRLDIRETLVYYNYMNEQNIQLKTDIIIPWDELDNLTALQKTLLHSSLATRDGTETEGASCSHLATES